MVVIIVLNQTQLVCREDFFGMRSVLISHCLVAVCASETPFNGGSSIEECYGSFDQKTKVTGFGTVQTDFELC